MLRKAIYFLVSSFISIFVYNLFLKEDFVIPVTESITSTINLIYKKQEIELKAEKMKEIGLRKEFEMISISLPDIIIRAKEAYTNDMEVIEFFGDVEVDTIDGYKFKANALNYNLKSENFTANGDFRAENKKEHINIEAQYCYSNKKFKKATFKDKVVINQEEMQIRCNLANYNQDENTFFLSDEVEIENRIFLEDDQKSLILLKSEHIEYNRKDKKALSDRNFELLYKDYKVKGKGFIYEENDTKFLSLSPILIINEKEEINIKADEGKYEKFLNLEKLSGSLKNIEFRCDKLITKSCNNLLILEKNVSLKRVDEEVTCDRLIFIRNKELIELKSHKNSKKVNICSKDFCINSNFFTYGIRTKNLDSKDFTKIIRNNLKIEGKNFLYNLDEEKGYIELVEAERDNFKIIAKRGIFDFKKGIHLLLGQIIIENRVLRLTSEEIEINEIEKMVFFKDDFRIISEQENIELLSKNGYFYDSSKEFKTNENITISKKDYYLKSVGIVYNLTDDIIQLKNEGYIFNNENKINIEFKQASFYNKEGKGFLINVKGRRDKLEFKSDRCSYLRERDLLTLNDNVIISQGNVMINSNSLDYYISTSDIHFEEESDVTKEDLLIIAQKGILNLDNKTLKAKDIIMFGEAGDIIESSELFLDYNMNEIIINKNIKGDLKTGVRFKASKGNIFFTEPLENTYEHKITRIELKNKVELNSKNIKLFCDFLEYNYELKWVYGRDNLKISVSYPDASANIAAKYAFVDIVREIGRMRNEVVITYRNEKIGNINTNSDEAILRYLDRKIALKGHVKSYGSKSNLKIYGDEANLDLNTGIVTSKGFSEFSYSFGEKIDKSEKLLEDIDTKEIFLKEHEEDLNQKN